MKLTNFVKNLTKKTFPILCSLLLVFISVFTISIFSPSYKVYADGVSDAIANSITNYLKSVTGVIKKTVDGIADLPNSVNDQISQYVMDNLNGNGIYEDGNGNYVFSNDFLNGYYDILSTMNNYNCYVCSDFSMFDSGVTNSYTNTQYNNNVIELTSSAKTYLANNTNYSDGVYLLVHYVFESGSYIYNEFYAYVLNNDFGYLSVGNSDSTSQTYKFYNYNGGSLSGYYRECYVSYDTNSGNYNNGIRDWKSISYILDVNNTSNILYTTFPNTSDYRSNFSDTSIFSSSSIIVCKNANDGASYISNTNNYIDYFKINNTTITISKTAIQNNNWTNIYNKYITNVNNEYNQGSDLTRKDVHQIMKKYTDVLLKNIADGVEDLEEKIEDTNEWLDKISQQIDEINAYLEQIANNLDNGVGGDGCAWTEEDVTRVKQILERFYLYSDDYLTALNDIDTNTDNLESDVLAVKTAIDNLKSYLETWKQKIDYIPTIADNTTNTDQKVGNIQTTLVTVSTALNTIISKLDGIGSGSNVDITIPSIDPGIIDDIVDLTEDKLGDLAGLLDVVGYVLQDAMPFCFVALAGVVVNALSAEPVAPDWVIPLSNSDGSISESMELDLSIFDGIHELWISLITILFVFGLISASFKIFQTFGVLVN